jgi:hypothetical protein
VPKSTTKNTISKPKADGFGGGSKPKPVMTKSDRKVQHEKKFDKKVEDAKQYLRQAETRPVTGMAGPGEDTRKAMKIVAKARQKGIIAAQEKRAAGAAQKLVRSKMTPEERHADKALLRGKTLDASRSEINKAREAAGRDPLKKSQIKERKQTFKDKQVAKGNDPRTGKPTTTTASSGGNGAGASDSGGSNGGGTTTPATTTPAATTPATTTPATTTPSTGGSTGGGATPPSTATPKTDNWVDATGKS